MNDKLKLTGYPSKDKPWLKFYDEGAYERANEFPKGKTVWDVMEEKLDEYSDVPAVLYFGRRISRKEFKASVYLWAKALKAMGIKEDEIVAVYGPFLPDIFSITFALNMIGAVPYFLKLAISEQALREETAESKIVIVFDGMWNNVKSVFEEDRFEKIIFVSASDSMSFPKNVATNILNKVDLKKKGTLIPASSKYLSAKNAIKLSVKYSGNVKAPFKSNRSAFITSSSGTTGNIVKGTIATNETVLAQLWQSKNAGINYNKGETCLTNFPPTASTSLNCLFLLPLFMGMTLMNDPRVSEDFFYTEIMSYKPNVVIATGSLWESFYRKVEKEIKQGHKIDLSFSKMWILGGEGTNPTYLNKWDEMMRACGSEFPLYSGHGQSELFAVATVNKKGCFEKAIPNGRPVINVGLPYPGTDFGVFDDNRNELSYNQRGELWIKTASTMKGYYGKPELTREVVQDGWLHTGDIAEMDENGFVYLYGRKKDRIDSVADNDFYLFDVANKIRENAAIDDVIVCLMQTSGAEVGLAAHIVFHESVADDEKPEYICQMDKELKEFLPEGVSIFGYKEHPITLPSSPTTAKKDKNRLAKEIGGYLKVIDGKLCEAGMK